MPAVVFVMLIPPPDEVIVMLLVPSFVTTWARISESVMVISPELVMVTDTLPLNVVI